MPFVIAVLLICLVILALIIRDKNNTIRTNQANFKKQLDRKEEIIALLRSDMSTLCAFARKHIAEESREDFRFYYDIYGAADIDIPNDVFFVNGYIPVKGHISEDTPYGDYTVYVPSRGHCYHSKRFCSSQYNRAAHAYDAISKYSPCPKCALPFPSAPPQWYIDIKRIMINNESNDKQEVTP